MSAVESRRKWLSWRTLWNCLRISGALFVIAAIYKIAEGVVMSDLRMVTKTIYIIFMWLVLAFALLIYGLLSPDLMEVILRMLGFKEEDRQKNDDKT